MADVIEGGLTQTQNAANPELLAKTAGGGNPLQAEMFQQALDMGKKKQGYLEQMQAARDAEMERYAQMVRQSQTPEASEAGMWGSMATAAAKAPQTWGGTGAMLAGIGGAYGENQALQQQQNLKSQHDLTKMREEATKSLESKDQQAAMLRAMQPKGFEPRKNADGTTTVFDKGTGLPVGTYGPQDIGKITAMTQTLAKAAMDKGEYTNLADATEWARTEAMRIIGASNQAVGNRTEPLKGDVGGIPTTQQPKPVTEAPSVTEPKPTGEAPSIDKNLEQLLKPEDLATARRLIARIQANPASAANDTKTLETLLGGYIGEGAKLRPDDVGKPVAAPITAPTPMARKDVPKEAGQVASSKAGADMYGASFKTNVLDPLTSFQDTGKIMQEFNRLGEMQSALKNGRLKEYMSGDAGKWALSVLPENSDLRKGIANAQEAEKLTAGMVNKILMAAKGVQTEGDANRARSQVTSIGTDPDANKYLEAYVNETARQLKLREQSGLSHKKETGSWEGYDDTWSNNPIMKEAKGSVKKLGDNWIGLTQYIDKFKGKNPGATDSDAIASWNRVK